MRTAARLTSSDQTLPELDPRMPLRRPPEWGSHEAYELPKLSSSCMWRFEDDCKSISASADSQEPPEVPEALAVRFCPYQSLDAPVFAVITKKHIVIYRLPAGQESGDGKVLTIIRDADPGALLYTCTWILDRRTSVPYLCVAGKDALIKVYDINKGRIHRTLSGHGGGINDLNTCPVNSELILSASTDTTVRVWSFDPIHNEQPCLFILGGEGHKSDVESAAWHSKGRYIVSGGIDSCVNLWLVPELPTAPVDSPAQVIWPHFSTVALHSAIVDCVAFFGDYILSKGNQDNVIIMWKIMGFSSEDEPDTDIAPLPAIHRPGNKDPSQLTRSAFVPRVTRQCPTQYERRMQFSTPKVNEFFYTFFELHHQPDQHPILTFANPAGSVYFWSLQRIVEYDRISTLIRKSKKRKEAKYLPRWLRPDTGNPATDTAASYSCDEFREAWDDKYTMVDGQHALEPHVTINVPRSRSASNKLEPDFFGRQISWSPNGEWCVVSGSLNRVLMLRRWHTPQQESSTTSS
ncbi:WD40-repeat-containing domain protein [Emericellopsis atlantica]|uniref:WD40-repeat-containing domain protein n=1 Tax=Emericellopsis atlantica TaxID=2614577 RepID=A0A9P7ZRQ5_9HYPO|nr:WD40-repeat-containing domain protein [Emericellopsis atlantica]KAG9256428.1 WD40-repeat-containing domain protein [Emericellopsis atlantica]